MTTTTKKYSQEAKKLLSGQIKGTRYTEEVREELEKANKCFDAGYIRYVVCGEKDQDAIWDAVKQVVANRKEVERNQAALTAEIEQILA